MTIITTCPSGNLLAGIQKNSLDTGLRQYDELTVDSYLCCPVLLRSYLKIRLARHPREGVGPGRPQEIGFRLRGSDDQWSMEHFEIAS